MAHIIILMNPYDMESPEHVVGPFLTEEEANNEADILTQAAHPDTEIHVMELRSTKDVLAEIKEENEEEDDD